MTKPKLWFVITLLLAILTGLLVFRYLTGDPEDVPDMAAQVIAKAGIQAGTKIAADMVETVEIPVEYLHPSAAADPKMVVGQFAIVDIQAGEAVATSKIAGEKSASELPYKIPAGFRAMTIPVNALSGVAGLLKPGHRVDVLVAYSTEDPVLDAKVVTLVQGALVLAIGSDMQKQEGPQDSDSVTLALAPADAELVALGEYIGNLKLAARPTGEEAWSALQYMDVARMLRMYP